MTEQRRVDEDLDALKNRLAVMSSLAEEQVRVAVDALLSGDRALTRRVPTDDQRHNDLQTDVDERCFTLLALQQPVAVDLRFVVAASRVAVEERVGDLAVNIAEAAARYFNHPPVKPLIDLPRMGLIVQRRLASAMQAFLLRNAALAEEILLQDDHLDQLKIQVFRELLTYMLGDSKTIEPGVDLILISRHLERIGDHATNIAEDAIFLIDARDVRHGGA
ncbi:MAG TPA: phosphate signaling complex protein PhoU [Vicinamibacterales bacterium]|nr:phosphate signaling complex protein PhoU [Vicinamibacterales bacterium]